MSLKLKPFFQKDLKSEKQVHENELMNRILQNRGIDSKSEIEYSMSNLIHPYKMKGMRETAEIISNHILSESKILIIGDYDCDGATSTSIAVEGLKMLGCKNVEFLVPDRVKHGYGLTPSIVEIAGKSEPDLIITVDNGIAAFEGALAVKNLKKPCQLVITDHHLASDSGKVPECDAIVNPNQPGCNFESKSVAGCGVMFYTIMGTRLYMRENGIYDQLEMKEPKIARLLDLVALGTVADVVPLDYNNRTLVDTGLRWINSGNARLGIKALLEVTNKEIGKVTSQDFGFALGPRINAAGRLDDMSIGIKCLLEDNENSAQSYAQELDRLNSARKEIEAEMVDSALNDLDQIESQNNGIVVYNENYHEGVVGIVASRLKDRFDRPIICFTDTEDLKEAKERLKRAIESGDSKSNIEFLRRSVSDSLIKGSSRSIPGIHLKHVFDEINKKRPDILSKFGGHAMAAGLSIKYGQLEEFETIFDSIVSRELTAEMERGGVQVDYQDIPPELMTLQNAQMIEGMKVWGQGFDFPVFSQKFDVLSKRQIGNGKHLKLEVRPVGSNIVFDAVAFNCVDKDLIPVDQYMEASFKLNSNEFRGNVKLQLLIDHLQDPELIAKMDIENAMESNIQNKNSNDSIDDSFVF